MPGPLEPSDAAAHTSARVHPVAPEPSDAAARPVAHERPVTPDGPSHPVATRRARTLALITVVLYPIGAGILLLWPWGWVVNRLNVRVWFAVTSTLGIQDRIGPDRFADILNVLLFVPFFWAVALLLPRWRWILLGLALSAGVETYQFIIGSRVASLIDVAMNTLGAAVGVGLGILTARLLRGQGRDARSSGC